MAWDAGTGLIIAVNKWDLIEEKDTTTALHGQRLVEERVPFLKAVPFLYESAKTGMRVRKVLDLILEIAAAREVRVPTAEVNRVLGELVERTQPPQKPGAEVKLLYASQIGTKPPVFAVVSNRPNMIVESYRRYLQNGFRDEWGFMGTPLRFKFRRNRGR